MSKKNLGRVRSLKEIRHWLEGLDSGDIEFIKIRRGDYGLDLTWATYLDDDDIPGRRPTQLQASAATFRQLIEAAMSREEIKKREL